MYAFIYHDAFVIPRPHVSRVRFCKCSGMKIEIQPSWRVIILLFVASFLVTAVFSASLKVFFADEAWSEVLVKGLVIPCFTWTVQLILSALYLTRERRLIYWTQLGVVCLIGSLALLPAAFFNLIVRQPSPLVSVFNVLLSVGIMATWLCVSLRARGFKARWAVGWVVLICINMGLYVWSIADAVRS